MNTPFVNRIVKSALQEDLCPNGDITTNALVPEHKRAAADIIVKTAVTISGLAFAKRVFKQLDPSSQFIPYVKDGERIKAKTKIATVRASARALLTGERTALNFLSYLSGIATTTSQFADKIKKYKTRLLDTRKTTPTLRILERYAVLCGGGNNHRFNLAAMAMIKDNHRVFAKQNNANLAQLVDALKSKTSKKIELEVDTLEELAEALLTKADIILLDNMSLQQTRQAVLMRNRINKKILLESSGGITLNKIAHYAAAGVERISIGALTHSPVPVDISLEFKHVL